MLKKILNPSKRILTSYQKRVKKIEKIHKQEIEKLSNEDLVSLAQEKTNEIDYLLAIVKEASYRTLGLSPFSVQLIGALSIIEGNISEMKTGEGKSLTAAIAATVLSLQNRKVYIVTVNDYLVSRDADVHEPLYNFFYKNVGKILSGDFFLDEKKANYLSDVIYGTASEFGFDYLRDHLIYELNEKNIKLLDFVIVDEIDSILIDEATTPLIISDSIDKDLSELTKINNIVKTLIRGEETEFRNGLEIDKKTSGDFIISEKEKNVFLTESGIQKVEKALFIKNLFNSEATKYLLLIENALMANFYYKEGVHYVKKENKIVLIDESTGRLSEGRQLSNGQHQAIEVKEIVPVSHFTIVKGEISYQKFFLLFNTLSGMTGTAHTEATEFAEIYKLKVVEIPTNKPVIREDMNDIMFITKDEKIKYFVNLIISIHKTGQPILIGTNSVKVNEELESILKRNNLSINVLNAKNAERESEIISHAGQVGAITLATNMAGRGVDIKLSEESKKLGGLFVLGFERYNNRRIDNQLRGRSGRQGDPGKSLFLVSFEDELISVFGDIKKTKAVLKKIGFGTAKETINSRVFSKLIEKAQKSIENAHFESRKYLVKFDNIIGKQRDIIFKERESLLEDFDPNEKLDSLIEFGVNKVFPYEDISEEEICSNLDTYLDITVKEDYPETRESLKMFLTQLISEKFEYLNGNQHYIVSSVRYIYLQTLDFLWIEHLTSLDSLKDGINLRQYNQKDPVIEFQREAFHIFENFITHLKQEILKNFIYLEINPIEEK